MPAACHPAASPVKYLQPSRLLVTTSKTGVKTNTASRVWPEFSPQGPWGLLERANMHLSSVRGVACAEEIAAGTVVSTTQQDSSFQFPAPLSIPRFISCRDMWSGETGGKNATFSRYCTTEPKTRKLILSKAIFVIMIWIKSIGRFQTGLAGFPSGDFASNTAVVSNWF